MKLTHLLGCVALASTASSTVFAHIQLDFPPARISEQKTAPCGAAGSVRGDNVTTFEAGETITIRWRETINHPGHYRISFDADGDDDFVEPASFTDFYTNESVLYDDIQDGPAGEYTYEITLPNVACERCTLQVVQVMTDKAPYGDGNDLYYQCADIVLTQSAEDMGQPEQDMGSDMSADMGEVEPPVVDMGVEPADLGSDQVDQGEGPTPNQNPDIEASGSACSSVGSSWLSLVFIWVLVGLRRRR